MLMSFIWSFAAVVLHKKNTKKHFIGYKKQITGQIHRL